MKLQLLIEAFAFDKYFIVRELRLFFYGDGGGEERAVPINV